VVVAGSGARHRHEVNGAPERMRKSLATLVLLATLSGSAWAAPTYEDAAAQFSARKYTDARKSAEAVAKTGDARAMAMLGAIYQNGLGTTPNEDEAIRWYSAAAEKNQREAQFSLAMIYLDGKRGVSMIGTGEALLEKAAANGHPIAAYNLAMLLTGDQAGSVDWPRIAGLLRLAADQGLADAQYNLGLLYLDGQGVEMNATEAATLFAKAAQQGQVDAELQYGVMVFRGEGVARNPKIGAEWLLSAAQHGNPIAQNRIARVLATGQGLPADPIEAAKWHLLATKAGRADAWLDDFTRSLTIDEMQQAEDRAAAFEPAQ
jgi:TPR repeat protein